MKYDEANKKVWIGTYDYGLLSYSIIEQKLKKSPCKRVPKFIIRDIMIADKKNLWISFDGAGIWILDRNARNINKILNDDIDNPKSLYGNNAYSILKDRDRIWTSTTTEGLQYTETVHHTIELICHKIKDEQPLHNNQINSILYDTKGNSWMATDDGISYHDTKLGRWKHYFTGRQLSFLSLAKDDYGHIFAGTYSNGLYILNESNGKEIRHFTEKDGNIFSSRGFVFGLFKDSQGDIWIGGIKGGIYCYHPSDNTLIKYDEQPVYCFSELSRGKIIIGCAYGMLLLDKKSGETKNLMTGNTVNDIAVWNNIIWASTSNNGIIGYNIENAKQIHFNTQCGMPSNNTRSLLVNGDILWIGADNSLCCIISMALIFESSNIASYLLLNTK